MRSMTSLEELADRARRDVAVFAEVLIGEPLWPHQIEAAMSPARIRVLRAGRQVGKSRLLAVLALWEAFRAGERHVLLLSASEDNAKDLLAEVSALANGSPLLSGAVADDEVSKVVLSNGSWVRSIPASAKQARGKSIDLLVIDEACFVAEDVWRAAKYSQAARPGSRLLLASSPYGRADAFFAVHDRLGLDGLVDVAGVTVETFVWPSTVSPLVQAAGLVEFWRATDPPRTFAAEVMAEWQDDQGAYFTAGELADSVADFEMIEPGAAPNWRRLGRVGVGLDWGMRVDSHALAVVGVLADGGRNIAARGLEPVLFVPWVESHAGVPYHRFIDRALDVVDPDRGGFVAPWVVSERNGVGEAPTETLRMQAWERRLRTNVAPVWTDGRRKETGFGRLKLLLQQGRLVLPRHPELLKQLSGLQLETLESGATRISVPERLGHDDLVMALMQAASVLRTAIGRYWERPDEPDARSGDELVTRAGTYVRERPSTAVEPWWAVQNPGGTEKSDGW